MECFAFFKTISLHTVLFEKDSQLSCIGHDCFFNAGLKWIELPAPVSAIGGGAFFGCHSLGRVWPAGEAPADPGEVRWPRRVTMVARSVLGQCAAVVLLVLPPTVERIEPMAFGGTTSLASVVFAADSRLWKIGDSCFAGSGLTSIDTPASVREVGYGAFQSCLRLTRVTFAEGSKLLRVGNCSFYGFAALRVLQFAKGSNPEFGSEALKGCTSLQVLRIPRAAPVRFAKSVPAGCRVEVTL